MDMKIAGTTPKVDAEFLIQFCPHCFETIAVSKNFQLAYLEKKAQYIQCFKESYCAFTSSHTGHPVA
jgi:hypothetical protein